MRTAGISPLTTTLKNIRHYFYTQSMKLVAVCAQGVISAQIKVAFADIRDGDRMITTLLLYQKKFDCKWKNIERVVEERINCHFLYRLVSCARRTKRKARVRLGRNVENIKQYNKIGALQKYLHYKIFFYIYAWKRENIKLCCIAIFWLDLYTENFKSQ